MSHRKRKPATTSPRKLETPGEKVAVALDELLRYNIRLMLLLIGGGLFLQILMPWTSRAMDNLWFVIVGGILLGLALPGRLWQ